MRANGASRHVQTDNGVLAPFGAGTFFYCFSKRQRHIAVEGAARYPDTVLQPATAEHIFVLGEDTVHSSSSKCRHVMLVIIALLLLPGCAITAPSSGRSTIIASLSYELPLYADVKSVVDFLEVSSARALKEPVTVDSGAASFLSGDAIHSVFLLEKITALEGLGEVAFPSISCPRALTTIHKLIAIEKGLRLVAGCVTVGASATRIDLLDVTTGPISWPTHSTSSHDAAKSSPISHIGAAFVDRFPAIRLVSTPDIPIRRVNRGLDAETVTPNIPRIMAATTSGDMITATAKTTALVCYAPATKGVSVRDNPDSDTVVGTLDLELIVHEEDPSTYLFLHITTRDGRVGWVKRTDVRWIPCPIV